MRAMTHHSRQDRLGFTMVEVIVATLIVGLVLVGAINLLGSAMQTRRINAQRLEGPALAHQLIALVL